MYMKSLLKVIAFCFFGITAGAQKKWDLRSIVDYAMTNNLTVKISDVQARIAKLTYKQSKSSQLPTLNFRTDGAISSGRTQDPVTFERVTETYFSSVMQLQSSADIFNFFSKRNTIAANNWELLASTANVDKLKNDIALTVANAYLQILLAKEQENITSVQVQQTTAQLANTKKLVDAGSLPPLNLTQLEAQLAMDSVNYITAKGTVVQNILTLKAYMSIDPAADFEVETPPVELIPLDPISELLPESVYSLALKNQPLQRYDELKIKAAEKYRDAAKGAMYPTLSAFGSLNTTYRTFKKKPYYDPRDYVITGYDTTSFIISNQPGSTILSPKFGNGPVRYLKPSAYGTQLDDNFNQNIGLSLNIPILNGRSLRTNYEKSKLNIETLKLQKAQDDQDLKQNIFQAYNSALIALEKFNASKKSVDASQLTYDYAKKRFDVGMMNSFDLISTQNNLLTAKLQYAINQFDYVFKMKVLEFYKGLGIKL
jgi:outer membrane protein